MMHISTFSARLTRLPSMHAHVSVRMAVCMHVPHQCWETAAVVYSQQRSMGCEDRMTRAHIQLCGLGGPEARPAALVLSVLRLPEDLPGGARELTAPAISITEDSGQRSAGCTTTVKMHPWHWQLEGSWRGGVVSSRTKLIKQ